MDKYHIYEEIGKGEFSQVFKGREKKKIEYVAIKRVDKSMMNKIVNEVQIMHKLHSPHMLKFHDWYETRNNLWLILEYCTGADLESLLRQDGYLPEHSVRMLGLDIIEALKYLHQIGILHCDIRPRNFLIDEYGIVKISDFKQARKLPKAPLADAPIETRGAPPYMAPELFLSEGVHSYSSDFWSVGCVLYELRRGVPPFGRQVEMKELIERIRTAKPVENPIVAMEPQSNGTTKKDIDIDRLPRENNHNQDHLNEDNKNIGIPRLSAELGDLLQSLLEKEPMHRCTWFDIAEHPFWGEKRPTAPKSLPAEPAYDKLVRDREKNRNMRLEAEVLSELGLSQSGIQQYQQTYYSDQNMHPSIVNATPIKMPHQSDSAVKADRSDRQMSDEAIRKRTDIRKIKEQHKSNTDDTNLNNSIDEYNNDTFEVDASTGSVATRIATARGPASPIAEQTVQNNENSLKNNQKDNSPSADIGKELSSPSGPLINMFDDNFDQDLSATHLIVHTSDTQVKPIVGNKAIEVIEKITIKGGVLPIPMLTLDEVPGLSTTELESHLSQVYKMLLKNSGLPSQQASSSAVINNSNAALTERAKILSYLNTIALSADVANIVLNTHFLSLLLKLLKSPSDSGSTQRARSAGGNTSSGLSSTLTRPGSGSAAPNLIANSVKTLLASSLAVMLRYATFIQPPNAKTRDDHILPVLVSLLRDNNKIEIKAKRRIVAALGEMIFYITSQDDEDTNAETAQWVLPSAAIAVLVKCLKDDTDEIIRHYAAKTIENVMAQGGLEYRRRLCISEVAIRLLEISQHGRNDNLQATAGMALAHMFMLVMTHEPLPSKVPDKEIIPSSRSKVASNPVLESSQGTGLGGARFVARVLEKGGLPAIIETLRDGQPKLQQAYLNIINIIFCPINIMKITQSTKKESVVSPTKGNAIKKTGSTSPFNSAAALTPSTILKPFQQFFLKTPAMVPTLLRLVEQGGSSAVRAKALITFQLLCSHRVTILTEHRLPSALMRMIEPYISNTDMSTSNTQNNSTYNIKCALSMVIFVRDTCIFALKDLHMQLSLLSTYQTSEQQLVTPESSPQKSGRTPHTLVRQTPSSASVKAKEPVEDNKYLVQPNIQSILQYSGILRSAVSIASQPALGRLILASGNFCEALSSVIKSLPAVREYIHNFVPGPEKDNATNAISQAEQASMFAVENVAQMDLLECLTGIQLNSQLPDRIKALVSDPEIGLSFILSLVNSLLPSIATLTPHPDGDIRVLVAASLRRLIPAALRAIIQTKYKDSAYNCISKYVPHISSQLSDQSPIPQYTIRLIADTVTVSPTIANEIMKDLKINGCVEVLIQLLRDGRGNATDNSYDNVDDERIQDPQLSILLRFMFERPEMSMKMLQCDVAGAVCNAVLNAVGVTTARSPITYDGQRAELLVPTVDLMLVILNYFIRSLAAIAENNVSPSSTNSKSPDRTNLSEQLHRLATPLRKVCPALFIILAGPKNLNPKDDDEESVLAMLRDSASRCLGILFDIFPDSVTSNLLSTSEISLGSNGSPNRAASNYSINSNVPRIIIAKIITQPLADIRLRIRLLKILAGVVKMAPALNVVPKVEEMFGSQPLKQALEIALEQKDKQYNNGETDDDRATIIRLARQIITSINK